MFIACNCTNYIPFCTVLCRLMIDECKKFSYLNVGFVDPDKVHNDTVRDNPGETENNLLRFFTNQKDRDSILFPYNYRSES
jgi:hypothetical protein